VNGDSLPAQVRSAALVAEKCGQMNSKVFYFLDSCHTTKESFCDNYVAFTGSDFIDFVAFINKWKSML
jgi:hypothetical protein